jgi:hypothetical protein
VCPVVPGRPRRCTCATDHHRDNNNENEKYNTSNYAADYVTERKKMT